MCERAYIWRHTPQCNKFIQKHDGNDFQVVGIERVWKTAQGGDYRRGLLDLNVKHKFSRRSKSYILSDPKLFKICSVFMCGVI